ncbi:MAG: UDP-N-acetylmuramoyl-tripeptide--D-alanyl-D-alanine ligase [Deltaproteobacteria bacterium]|nr:UDP-N-acetylmuramoyl-tripeptide--D-alanyl-D-alanine ligase [Deltaproteobacteria bacterium]
MDLTVSEVIQATGARLAQRGASDRVRAIAIDSRTFPDHRTVADNWFVAIRGPHFDGHDFVPDAAAKGAAGVIVSRAVPAPAGVTVLVVADTVTALGAIAARWRAAFARVPCVAVTGSNGKSTTKEMVAAVAAERGAVLKTEGNFNNLIGLPLTVFRWAAEHRTAVLEIGMSAAGEIAALTRIVAPDVGLITNVTAAHLDQLQTVEHVAAAKGELFRTMRPDGTICVNVEDPHVRALAAAFPGRRITYGMQNGCDVQFGRMTTEEFHQADLTLYVRGAEHRLSLPVPGAHNVMNAMAAVAVGLALEVPVEAMLRRLPTFQPMKMRMEHVQLVSGVQVINDAYNANPLSMEAALKTVGAAKRAGRFFAVLGDMLELGPEAARAHRRVGEQAARYGAQRVFASGAHAREVAEGARAGGLAADRVAVIAAMEDLQRAVLTAIQPGDVVLVKGSRGMHMERVVEFLKAEIGTD